MIPAQNVVAWSRTAPWAEPRQVEQDLIISRALVELFSDPFLRGELRFRGGTALNKLHFPTPQRYSEDIDLVRTTGGPIGPVLDQIRTILVPWLGRPRFDQSDVAPKFRFRVQPEGEGAPIRIKIEINTREREAYDPPVTKPFRVENPWFAGEAAIPTFSIEEMLATKLRALLQRNKGRDLVDLSHALEVFPDLSAVRVVELLGRYLALSEQTISPGLRPKRECPANSSGLTSCRMSGRCSPQMRQVASMMRRRELCSFPSSLASYGCCPATHGRTRLP
jgi:predicted nucleotidyltransferase component of viral defense system